MLKREHFLYAHAPLSGLCHFGKTRIYENHILNFKFFFRKFFQQFFLIE